MTRLLRFLIPDHALRWRRTLTRADYVQRPFAPDRWMLDVQYHYGEIGTPEGVVQVRVHAPGGQVNW